MRGDAALMKAFLTEQLQRGVQNALPGWLPACAHPRIVREGSPARDEFGIGALRHLYCNIPRCHITTVAVAERACASASWPPSPGVTGKAPRQDSARTLSFTAGTIGGASFQFGSPLSSLATG